MKLTLPLLLCFLAACSNLTLNQKRALAIGGSMLVVGFAAAHGHGDTRPAEALDIPRPSNPCSPNPNVCK